MHNSNRLNALYEINENAPHTMVFLHGLFGDLNNLGVIARAFADHYSILKVDLRNHGQSFHSEEMNYSLMAQDVVDLLKQLAIKKAIVIGHSMGGKTAMAVAALAPELVEKLVVIDIAPVAYPGNRHTDIFAGLFAVKAASPANRIEARSAIAEKISDPNIQQFMLKSFDLQAPDRFKFNLTALEKNYHHLMDWQPVYVDIPTLFIKGERSDYLQTKDTDAVLAQFPQAKLFIVSHADHWVHAEKPDAVIRAMEKFLS